MSAMKKLLLTACLFLHCALSLAAQDHAALKDAVTAFIMQQTSGLPGKVTFSVEAIDPRLVLENCSKMEAFLPAGGQLIGRVSVGVRCLDSKSWRIFIPVQIKITRDLIISAKPLSSGQVLRAGDIARQSTETMQDVGITDEKRVLGKVLRYSIAVGSIIKPEMLRASYSVKQGQSVQIIVRGGGFTLSNMGVALNNAGAGESVQVRIGSGRVISGTATDEGSVEINP